MLSRSLQFSLAVVFSCPVAAFGQIDPAETRRSAVDRIVPNVVWLRGASKAGSGTLLHCRPHMADSPKPLARCLIQTVSHVLDDERQRLLTVQLASGEHSTVWLRELSLSAVYASPRSRLNVASREWSLTIGPQTFEFEIDSDTPTLRDLEDALNRLAAATKMTAGIAALGPAGDRTFTLKLYPMSNEVVPTSLVNGGAGENLLSDVRLWTGIRDLDLALVEAILPASALDHALDISDFASEAQLARMESGDELRCSGYAIPPNSIRSDVASYAGVKSARIYSYPFPPARSTASFEVDASLSSGQSGAPCFVTLDGHPLIVGTVVSHLLLSRGGASEPIPNINLVLKSSVIREAYEKWEEHSAR